MWAGGSLRVNPHRPLLLNGARAACVERIVDVTVKGNEGNEKVFVGIERRVGVVGEEEEAGEGEVLARFGLTKGNEGGEEGGGGERGREEEGGGGEWSIIERRNLVFMREAAPTQTISTTKHPEHQPQQQQKEEVTDRKTKILHPPTTTPDFEHTFTPTPRLLFRYSALTWNAHAIHLDPSYVRDVEGHRGLLVHGPLSFTLLVTNLRRHLATMQADNKSTAGQKKEEVEFVEYRNLAPLYTDEAMKLCGRKKEKGKWEVWVEGPDGGVKVRGVVRTRIVASDSEGMKSGYGDLAMMMGGG